MAAQMTSQAHGWYSAVRAFLLNSIGIFLPAFMEGSAVAGALSCAPTRCASMVAEKSASARLPSPATIAASMVMSVDLATGRGSPDVLPRSRARRISFSACLRGKLGASACKTRDPWAGEGEA